MQFRLIDMYVHDVKDGLNQRLLVTDKIGQWLQNLIGIYLINRVLQPG